MRRGRGASPLEGPFGGHPAYFEASKPASIAKANVAELRRQKIRIICGTADSLFVGNKKFDECLPSLDVPHEFRPVNGSPHNHDQLLAFMDFDPFQFYGKVFAGLVPPPGGRGSTDPRCSRFDRNQTGQRFCTRPFPATQRTVPPLKICRLVISSRRISTIRISTSPRSPRMAYSIMAAVRSKAAKAIKNVIARMRNPKPVVGKQAGAARHNISNIVIRVEGNRATSRSYWFHYSNDNPERRGVFDGFGHYEDEVVKVNGNWLFTKRKIYNEGRNEWAYKGAKNSAW